MTDDLRISVVIPAHNAQNTLARALDSVLAQSRPPHEIIVVDDASRDGTAAIAHSYRDRGVVLVSLDRQKGAAAARNAGIATAGGAWVAFLDADDEWLPVKLEKQAAAIRADPDAVLVFCASDEFLPDGTWLGDTFQDRPVTTGAGAWKHLLARNFVNTSTVVASRARLLQTGGFDETLKVAQDQDMWIRLALLGRLAYVPENLVHIYVQPTSLSVRVPWGQFEYTLPMIARHVARLKDRLTKDEIRRIMDERLTNAGLIACARGDMRRGLGTILRAALVGHKPLGRIGLAAKIPVAAAVKHLLWRLNLRPTAR